VTLTEVPADKKIAVLKVVRTITGLGLKEAKTMVEGAPIVIKEGASKDESEDIAKQIEAAGGKTEAK
jgi:large subunit ribosomal protein L7/L12